NFGLLCTTGYRLIWDLIPNSFSGIAAGTNSLQASGTLLYFSFVVLTTVGFGDIVPVHPFARGLANLEGIKSAEFVWSARHRRDPDPRRRTRQTGWHPATRNGKEAHVKGDS